MDLTPGFHANQWHGLIVYEVNSGLPFTMLHGQGSFTYTQAPTGVQLAPVELQGLRFPGARGGFTDTRHLVHSPAMVSGVVPSGAWLNAAASVALSGAALFLLRLLRGARAAFRSRRKQCVHCGYPHLSDSATTTCPECGYVRR
jgi:ribosomal protein L37E